jgi:uncharacterized protein YggU (UPF0235/DUF167 family)
MRLNVKVFPNAKIDSLVQEEGRSRVYLMIPTDGPKLNRALIKFLAAHFNVEANKVSIETGENRREKLVNVMKD